jgi:hypothetical protein
MYITFDLYASFVLNRSWFADTEHTLFQLRYWLNPLNTELNPICQ